MAKDLMGKEIADGDRVMLHGTVKTAGDFCWVEIDGGGPLSVEAKHLHVVSRDIPPHDAILPGMKPERDIWGNKT